MTLMIKATTTCAVEAQAGKATVPNGGVYNHNDQQGLNLVTWL